MSRNIWCLSGLGADHRVFAKLSIPGYTLRHLPWIDPDKHDDLGCYAQKMAAQITDDKPIILGVSFGGMVGIEISHLRPVSGLFLISSAKNREELPRPGRFVRFFVNNGLIPTGLSGVRNKFTFDLFGAETDEEKDLLISILRDTDGALTRWAMKAILNWQQVGLPEECIHIHGTADRILPIESVAPTYQIEGGSHLMIYNRAAEISAILKKHLPGY